MGYRARRVGILPGGVERWRIEPIASNYVSRTAVDSDATIPDPAPAAAVRALESFFAVPDLPPRPNPSEPEPALIPALGRRKPRAIWRHPADELPAMADLEQLIYRAELLALAQWRHEHGEVPLGERLDLIVTREAAEAMAWWRQWMRWRLFELVPYDQIPKRLRPLL
jgi:hypothetical protein